MREKKAEGEEKYIRATCLLMENSLETAAMLPSRRCMKERWWGGETRKQGVKTITKRCSRRPAPSQATPTREKDDVQNFVKSMPGKKEGQKDRETCTKVEKGEDLRW